ncbi:MAG: LysM peptidoglycan-binding domain-containing protein, partial [Candidatus Paceibacterota bacterium]
QFDSMVLNGYNPYNQIMSANIKVVDNKVPYTVIQPNQKIEDIANENNKSERKIIKYNDLQGKVIHPGDVVYLKPKKRKASVESHTVTLGDNMWLISQKYAVKLNVLYKKNKKDDGTEPKPGEVIQLRSKTDQRPDTGRIDINEVLEKREQLKNQQQFHIVTQGETLFGISRKYNISVEDIKKHNHLKGDQVYLGQKLWIVLEKDSFNTTNTIKHTVILGETLYAISRKYDVSVANIKKWNELKSDALFLGQIIFIFK